MAYYFPPLGGIGSGRTAAFARYLPRYGWEPTVLAPLDGAYFRDPELTFPEDKVVRSRSVEISRAGKRLLRAGGDDVRAAQVGRGKAILRAVARATVYFPDAHVGWYPAAVRDGRRLLERESFDAILSTSVPITSHLIARRLRRVSGLPWVAEFRDPWSENVPGRVAGARAARLERSIAAEAAALVMTSPTWAEQASQRWGRPVSVITNGHDGVPAQSVMSSDGFTVTYLGTYYPATQDLRAAWDALRSLRGSGDGPDRIRFIGELHPQLRAELDAAGLGDLVEVTGFRSHDDALAHLVSSSVLLLAGPRDLASAGHIPGKVFEYLATDLPVVYVGEPGADLADLVRRFDGCRVCGADDPGAVENALRQARGRRRYERDTRMFTRPALAGELARLLDSTQPGGGA